MNAVGIDLGGTQIKAVLVSDSGDVLRRELRPTSDDGTDARRWAEAMRDLVDELGPQLPVGISAPGLAERGRRWIAHMPGRLQGLEQLNWTEFLGRDALVPVTNDAHASLLGEAWIGATRGLRDCFMLTLGTGVGGAVLADGQLLRGHLGRAGHLGHICLDINGAPDIVRTPGSLEDMIGNHNIGERTGGRFTTTHALIAAYRENDPEAARVWLASIRALACGIASLINVLDPEAIILGGGIAQSEGALFEPLAAELERVEWRPAGHRVRLMAAQLGEWAGAIGAAREAMNLR
ncbi:ROK family protein [Verrucomicrobiota bacterium sgz303538]